MEAGSVAPSDPSFFGAWLLLGGSFLLVPGSKTPSRALSVFLVASWSTRPSTVLAAASSAFLANFLRNCAFMEVPARQAKRMQGRSLFVIFMMGLSIVLFKDGK